jgi:hypothetical protein
MFPMVNPFSTQFWVAGVLPFQFSDSRENIDVLAEKARRHPVCQIVGPHGSGKSTLLLELRKQYENNGTNVRYLFFNDQQRRIPGNLTFQEDQTLFVDGFEQLSLFRKLWLRFRSAHLILTVHRPVWGIPILYRTQPQFSVFVQIVRQMVPNPPEESALRTVYDRSGGNFRNAFFELYDLFAKSGE